MKDAVDWSIRFSKSVSSDGKPKVGDTLELSFQASIKPGYHIYSSIPPKKDANMPTELVIEKISGLTALGKLSETGKSHSEYDEVFETDVRWFDKKVTFVQKFKITKPEILLSGFLDFQVCDTMTCVPGKKEISYTLKALPNLSNDSISTPLDSGTQVSESVVSEEVKKDSEIPSKTLQRSANSEQKDEGFFWFLITAFLGGLLALFTPCVFPMIPMTVSFFTKQSKTKGEAIRKAFIYTASIVIIYTLLGVLVSATVGAGKLNEWSTSATFNIIFFLVCIIFSISFFGMFEITLPSSIVNKMDKASDKGGLIGIFFMAFTLTLVSFSCTGPIIGTLLVEAASGSYLRPAAGMAAYSFAFAIPFGVFAAFPGWMHGLPKSGGWLNSVKVVLGFLELALALKFLSIADLTYEWGILDREVYLICWIIIFVMLGFYLLGKIKLPHDSDLHNISVPRFFLAMISFAFSFYMVMGVFGHPVKMLSGLIPSISEDQKIWFSMYGNNRSESKVEGKSVCDEYGPRKYSESLHAPHNLCAFFDYNEGLAYAKKVKKPILIDFTGKGCVNCRKMEDYVWIDPRVLKSLKEDYVLISLYVDLKRELPENEKYTAISGKKIRTVGDIWANLQEERFKTNSQPQYVVLNTSEEVLSKPVGYDKDVNKFIEFLSEGLKNFKNNPD